MPFFKLIIAHFTRNHEIFYFRLIGLLVICTALATFSAAAQTLEITVYDNVSEHWRGAYDLLVRPQPDNTGVEQISGLVEANYLGASGGGITAQQYEMIRGLSEVEVAAPVAAVGFVLNDTGTIGVRINDVDANSLYGIEAQISEANDQGFRQEMKAFFISSQEQPNNDLFITGTSLIDTVWTRDGFYLSFGDLPPLWALVAGIDPDQEAKLVGLDRFLVQGDYFTNRKDLNQSYDPVFNRKATEIPILISQQSYLPLLVSINISQLSLDNPNKRQLFSEIVARDAGRSQEVLDQLSALLSESNPTQLLEQEINLESFIQPLSALNLIFSPGLGPEAVHEGSYSSFDRNVLLLPSAFEYASIQSPVGVVHQPVYQVLEQGLWEDEVENQLSAFRLPEFSPVAIQKRAGYFAEDRLFRKLKAYEPPPFIMSVKGTFDFNNLASRQDELTYTPLGIYEPPVAWLRFDPNGAAVEPKIISPGLNPADFIPRPPLALTTLEGAAYLTGREDFIDAIRVRLKGIDAYTPENILKVERVAAEISERSGLRVDIVAGSSPQKVLVFVSGVGYVEEQWTSLGAVTKVTSGLNFVNLTLMGSLLLAAGLFIGNSAQLTVLSHWEEIGLLKAVGWRTRQVVALFLGDSFLVSLIAAVLAASASLALILALGLKPDWPVILSVAIVAPILYITASIPSILQISKKAPVDSLRAGEVYPFSSRLKRWIPWKWMPFNYLSLAFRHLGRRRMRTGLSVLLIATGVAISLFFMVMIVEMQGKISVTLLGQFITLKIRSYHSLMIATALTMSVLATTENLLSSVIERSRDLGLLKALGWRAWSIVLSIVWEGTLIGIFGGLIGSFLGIGLFQILTDKLPEQLPVILLLSIFCATLIGILAAIYPAVLAGRLTPAELIRGEKLSSRTTGSPRPFWNRAAGLGLLVISLVGVVLIWSRTSIISPLFRQVVEGEDVSNPYLDFVLERALFEHVSALTNLGPRAFGNPAEQKAADYIAARLHSYGLKVTRQTFPLSLITIANESSSAPFSAFPGPDGDIQGIAFHSSDEVTLNSIEAPALFFTTTSIFPAAQNVSGKILLIQAEQSAQRGQALRQLIAYYGQPAPYIAAMEVALTAPESLNLSDTQNDLKASIPVAENISAALPGDTHPEKEIWIVASYDSNPASSGADANGSGVSVLLELARVFAKNGSPFTMRFLFLTGTSSGLEGAISYLQAHESQLERVSAVIALDRVGAWENLSIGSSLSAEDVNGNQLSIAEMDQFRKSGLSFMQAVWLNRLDLGRTDLLTWLDKETARQGGRMESPSELIDMAVQSSVNFGVQVDVRSFPCDVNYLAFIYRDFPALAICGTGNELSGTEYDTLDTLRADQIKKAWALSYDLITRLTQIEK